MRQRRDGFTLVELMVGLALGSLIATGVVMIMIAQQRSYAKQQEIGDVRDSERSAIVSLNWELRHALMGGSSLQRTAADSVTLRSLTGSGIVCGKHATLPRFALWRTAGTIAATADDTALVYSATRVRWRKVKINAVGTPAAMGVTSCAWAGGRAPDLVVEIVVTSKYDTADVLPGSPFRSYRQVTYAEIQNGGKWWLGRRVGNGAWDQLTGPIYSPANRGLKFAYFDSLGATPASPATASSIALVVRAMSERQFLNGADYASLTYAQDSFTTKVRVRR